MDHLVWTNPFHVFLLTNVTFLHSNNFLFHFVLTQCVNTKIKYKIVWLEKFLICEDKICLEVTIHLLCLFLFSPTNKHSILCRICIQLLERGPLMWMMPLHLHVNQKSDYDMMMICTIFQFYVVFAQNSEKQSWINILASSSDFDT